MEYDAIVVGAGTAGLAAGLKLAYAGKKILVIEKQPIPGGFATTFTRSGFTFESSLHCVDGLDKDSDIRIFLKECGIDERVSFIELDNFTRIIYPEHDFAVDFNPQNFINFLKKEFPQEENGISRLFKDLDRFYDQFDKFSNSNLPLWLDLVASPFIYPSIIKTSGLTVEQFIKRYIKDERLKAIITSSWGFAGLPPSRLSALYFLLVFGSYYYETTAYVKGGFIQLFKAMAERIKEFGSEVKFNTTVTQIITEEGKRVKAVVTDKGERFEAKAVISNANAIDTLSKFIDDELLRQKYHKRLSSMEKSLSALQVYLGLKVPAKDLGMSHFLLLINTTYNHEDSFHYHLSGDYERCPLELVDHGQIDPTLVPQGKGSLSIFIFDKYSNWDNLKDDEYKKKKFEVADKLISRSEKYLPGLSEYIEVTQVATPKTMSKYGSSPQGAIYGFAQTVNQSGINRLSQETDIKGLFLTGAWTRPGAGVHACFLSGIDAAQLALKLLR